MNCYVCDAQGRGEIALATCPTCTVGLCRRHLSETLQEPGPGGARYRCTHVTVAASPGRAAAR